MHNDLVNLAIDNWTISSNDPIAMSNEFARIIINKGQLLMEKHNLNFDEVKNIVDPDQMVSILLTMENHSIRTSEYWNEIGSSPEFTTKALGLVDVIDNVSRDENTTVNKIKNAVNNFYKSNQLNLNQEDLIKLGMMVDVANHSAELWLPTRFGGQNKFFEFTEVRNSLPDAIVIAHTRDSWWSTIILSDAVGAVGAAATAVASTGGTAAVPNPLTGGLPPASLAGIIGGAFSSINSTIHC